MSTWSKHSICLTNDAMVYNVVKPVKAAGSQAKVWKVKQPSFMASSGRERTKLFPGNRERETHRWNGWNGASQASVFWALLLWLDSWVASRTKGEAQFSADWRFWCLVQECLNSAFFKLESNSTFGGESDVYGHSQQSCWLRETSWGRWSCCHWEWPVPTSLSAHQP